jgi:hypothetical protein
MIQDLIYHNQDIPLPSLKQAKNRPCILKFDLSTQLSTPLEQESNRLSFDGAKQALYSGSSCEKNTEESHGRQFADGQLLKS